MAAKSGAVGNNNVQKGKGLTEKEQQLLKQMNKGVKKPKNTGKKVATVVAAALLTAATLTIPAVIYYTKTQGIHVVVESIAEGMQLQQQSMKLKKGATIGDIKVPNRPGYFFAGFYADESLTQQLSPDTKISEGTTIYLYYVLIRYKFNVNSSFGEYLAFYQVQGDQLGEALGLDAELHHGDRFAIVENVPTGYHSEISITGANFVGQTSEGYSIYEIDADNKTAEDKYINITYEQYINTYYITFFDEDGSALAGYNEYAKKGIQHGNYANIPNPEKQSTVEKQFKFTNWLLVDKDNNPILNENNEEQIIEFSNFKITQDIFVRAEFESEYREYALNIAEEDLDHVQIFLEEDGSDITINKTVRYGQKLKIIPSPSVGYHCTVLKVNGVDYSTSFEVTGDVNIEYDEEINTYKVNFFTEKNKIGKAELITSKLVTHGQGVDASDVQIPEKEQSDTFTYTFKTWVTDGGVQANLEKIELVNQGDEFNVYASYTEHYREYELEIPEHVTITYLSGTSQTDIENHTAHLEVGEKYSNQTINLHFDDKIKIEYQAPEGFTGAFTINGMVIHSGDSYTVAGKMELSYSEEINEYTVRFLDDDGQPIQTVTVKHGGTANFSGKAPTRESTNTFNYTHSGWEEPLTNITSDKDIHPTFKATYIEYAVEIPEHVTLTYLSGTSHLDSEEHDYAAKTTENGEYTHDSNLTLHYGDTFKLSYTSSTGSHMTKLEQTGASEQNGSYTVQTNVKITYEEEVNSYTVEFYDEDKVKQLGTVTVKHNQQATIDEPTKQQDNTYTYKFNEWKLFEGDLSATDALEHVQLTNHEDVLKVYANYTATAIEYQITLNADNVTITFVQAGEAQTSHSKDKQLHSGDTLHYGDIIKIAYTPTDGYHEQGTIIQGATLFEGNYKVENDVNVTYKEVADEYKIGEIPANVTITLYSLGDISTALGSQLNGTLNTNSVLHYGDKIKLTYNHTGYTFNSFTIDSNTYQQNDYIFEVKSNIAHISVSETENTYTLSFPANVTVHKNSKEGPTVTSDQNNNVSYTDTLYVEFTTPKGHKNGTLTVEGLTLEGDHYTISSTENGAKISIEYQDELMQFTLNTIPENVSIKREGSPLKTGDTVKYGEKLEITFTTQPGHENGRLNVEGLQLDNGNIYTVTETDEEKQISVTYEDDFVDYKLNINILNEASGNVTVMRDGKPVTNGENLHIGDELTISVEISHGYHQNSLKVNGENTTNFTVGADDVTITLDASANTFTITPPPGVTIHENNADGAQTTTLTFGNTYYIKVEDLPAGHHVSTEFNVDEAYFSKTDGNTYVLNGNSHQLDENNSSITAISYGIDKNTYKLTIPDGVVVHKDSADGTEIKSGGIVTYEDTLYVTTTVQPGYHVSKPLQLDSNYFTQQDGKYILNGVQAGVAKHESVIDAITYETEQNTYTITIPEHVTVYKGHKGGETVSNSFTYGETYYIEAAAPDDGYHVEEALNVSDTYFTSNGENLFTLNKQAAAELEDKASIPDAITYKIAVNTYTLSFPDNIEVHKNALDGEKLTTGATVEYTDKLFVTWQLPQGKENASISADGLELDSGENTVSGCSYRISNTQDKAEISLSYTDSYIEYSITINDQNTGAVHVYYVSGTSEQYSPEDELTKDNTVHFNDTIRIEYEESEGKHKDKFYVNESEFTSGETKVVDGPVEIVYKEVDNYYQVTLYNYDGTQITQLSVKHNDVINYSQVPTHEENDTYDYTFAGWSTEQNGENLIDLSNTHVTDDVTYANLYAQFKQAFHEYIINIPEHVTLTYLSGTSGNLVEENTHNAAHTPHNQVTYTHESGDVKLHFGDRLTLTTQPTLGSHVTVLTVNGDDISHEGNYTFEVGKQNVIVYDEERNEYVVTFYNGSEVYSTVNVKHGDTAVLDKPDPVHDKDLTFTYEFLGWSKLQDSEVAQEDALQNVTGKLDLYAVYKKTYIPYYVQATFDGVSVTFVEGSSQYESGKQLSASDILHYNDTIKFEYTPDEEVESFKVNQQEHKDELVENAFTLNITENITSIEVVEAVYLIYTPIDGGWQVDGFKQGKDRKEVVIPDFYKEQPVLQIKSNAFNDNETITSVKIGNNVKRIEDNAFACKNLQHITLGTGITFIGTYAFHTTNNTIEIEFGSSIKNAEISENALPTTEHVILKFTGSMEEWLEGVYMEEVEGLNGGVFSAQVSYVYYLNCLGDNITYNIGGQLISGDLSLPESTTQIPVFAFVFSPEITSITIPENVTSIGLGAFAYLPNLSTINYNARNINDFVTEDIVQYVLQDDFTNSVLPEDNVIFYADGVDWDIGNRKEITLNIGKNVKHIPGGLFAPMYKEQLAIIMGHNEDSDLHQLFDYSAVDVLNGVPNITSINIQSDSLSLGTCAFMGLNATELQLENVTSIGSFAFAGMSNIFYIKDIIAKDYVNFETDWPQLAPKTITGLKTLRIPSTADYIGKFLVAGSYNLTNLIIDKQAALEVYETDEESLTNFAGRFARYLSDAYNSIIDEYIQQSQDSETFTNIIASNIFIPESMQLNKDYTNLLDYFSFYETTSQMEGYKKFTTDYSLGVLTYEIVGDHVEITGINADKSTLIEVVIPDRINNLWVTTIRTGAFKDCPVLQKVTFSKYINTIQSAAFENCPSLNEAAINGFNVFDYDYFNYDFDSYGGIAEDAYKNCQQFTNLRFNMSNNAYFDGIEFNEVGDYYEVMSTLINGANTETGYHYYTNEGEIAGDITVNSSRLSDGCFVFNTHINNVTIGENVKSIGNAVFVLSSVKSVDLTHAKNLKSIGKNAFSLGGLLETIDFTNATNLESIGDEAFKYTSCEFIGLSTLTGLKTIGDSAFHGCSSLTEVTIPSGVYSIGKNAFADCENINKIYFNATDCSSLGDGVFDKSCTKCEVIFGDTVNKIPARLFYNSNSSNKPDIISVTISSSVTDVGSQAFDNYMNLKVNYLGTLEEWCQKFNGAGALLSRYNKLYIQDVILDANLEIPDGVTKINACAFRGQKIKSVSIPESVKTIGIYAFEFCDSLTDVTILSPEIYQAATSANGAGRVLANAATVTVPKTIVDEYENDFLEKGDYIQTQVDGNVVFRRIDTVYKLYKVNSSNYRIDGFANDVTLSDVVIPDSFAGIKITEIGANAFEGNQTITSITIGKNITKIGDNAFNNCNALTDVTILSPTIYSAISEISACGGIVVYANSITVPKTIVEDYSSAYISDYYTQTLLEDNVVFRKTDQIFTLTLNGENYYVAGFVEGVSLSDVIIPDSFAGTKITEIGARAFEGNQTITSVKLGANITRVADYAFQNCTSLSTIDLQSAPNLQRISQYGFNGCSALRELDISSLTQFTYLSDYTFQGCSQLQTVILPASLETISHWAFYQCVNLQTVDLSRCTKLKTIGAHVFRNTAISEIIIPENVQSISDQTFSGCNNLKDITVLSPTIYGKLTSTTACGNLLQNDITLTVPKTIVDDNENDFLETSGEFIRFEDGNNYQFKKALNTYLKFSYLADTDSLSVDGFKTGQSETNVEIPDEFMGYKVTEIKDTAFRNLEITSVSIGANVKEIGDCAFEGCKSLTDVELSNATALQIIRGGAFRYCSSLTSISIPESVTTIEEVTFYDCTALETINFNAIHCADLIDSSRVFNNAGKDGSGITVTFGDQVEYVPTYLFHTTLEGESPNIVKVIFGSGVTQIGDASFWGCTSLTSVDFSHATSLQKIGTAAFSDTNLSELDLSQCTNLTTIGVYSFQSNGNLTSVTLPEGLLTICNSAFRDCALLTSITIPSTVTSIESVPDDPTASQYAFYGCTNLTDVTILSDTIYKALTDVDACGKLIEHATTITVPKSIVDGYRNEFLETNYLKKQEDEFNVVYESLGSVFNLEQTDEGYTVQGLSDDYSDITELNIPDAVGGVKVTSIAAHAFENNLNLNKVNIGKNVQTIGDSAFSGLINVTALNFNAIEAANVGGSSYCFKNLGDNVGDCTITFGDDVKVIPGPMFDSAHETKVVLGAGVQEIRQAAFWSNSRLREVDISRATQLTTIMESAFYSCVALNNITIPDSVTTIGHDAFINCTGLQTLTIGKNVQTIGDSAFSGLTNLEQLYFNAINCADFSSSNRIFYNLGIGVLEANEYQKCANVVIGDAVQHVPAYMFYSEWEDPEDYQKSYVAYVDVLTIGKNVKTFGDKAFHGLGYVTQINYNAIEADDLNESAEVFTRISDSKLNTLTIGDEVRVIPAYMFKGAYVKKLELGANLEEIKENAFNGIYGATSGGIEMDVSKATQLTTIGEKAFYNTNFEEITIPASVQTIGDMAFAENLYVKQINFNASQCSVGEVDPNVFLNVGTQVSEGTKFVIGKDVDTIPMRLCEVSYSMAQQGAYANITSIEVEEDSALTTILDGAFIDLKNLTTVDLTNAKTLSTIGFSAFSGCTSLVEITIPENVQEIQDLAFFNCTELKHVTILSRTIFDAATDADAVGGLLAYATAITLPKDFSVYYNTYIRQNYSHKTESSDGLYITYYQYQSGGSSATGGGSGGGGAPGGPTAPGG